VSLGDLSSVYEYLSDLARMPVVDWTLFIVFTVLALRGFVGMLDDGLCLPWRVGDAVAGAIGSFLYPLILDGGAQWYGLAVVYAVAAIVEGIRFFSVDVRNDRIEIGDVVESGDEWWVVKRVRRSELWTSFDVWNMADRYETDFGGLNEATRRIRLNWLRGRRR
jgi:hypothetical protein